MCILTQSVKKKVDGANAMFVQVECMNNVRTDVQCMNIHTGISDVTHQFLLAVEPLLGLAVC
jgi:hypothetical protein